MSLVGHKSLVPGPSVALLCAVLTGPAQSEATPSIFGFDCTHTGAVPSGMEQPAGDIGTAIARYWNLGAADADALASRIVVRACFSPDRHLDRIVLLAAEGPSEVAVTQLFETASRAIKRAHASGEIPLPLELYDSWRVLDLVFDANGMRLR